MAVDNVNNNVNGDVATGNEVDDDGNGATSRFFVNVPRQ
jgi:hypothetical protein